MQPLWPQQIAISPPGLRQLPDLRAWAGQAQARGADGLLLRPPADASPTAVRHMLRGLEADGRAQPVALGLNHSPSWQAWQNADSESKEAFWPTGLGFLHLKSDVLVPLAAEWAKLRNAGLRLGRSCHSPAEVQLAADDGFDFVFLSPIFPTASHPATPALGLGALAAVCNGTPMRVYALGGVESETQAQACRQAGAAGVAAIRWFAA